MDTESLKADALYLYIQKVGITGHKMVRLKMGLLHTLVRKVDPNANSKQTQSKPQVDPEYTLSGHKFLPTPSNRDSKPMV